MARLHSKWVGNLLRFYQGATAILDIDGANDAVDVKTDGKLKLAGTAIVATAAEINRAADVSGRLVTVTTTPLAIAEATHEGKTVVLSKADALAVTLPAATGSGARYRFIVGITASGGNYTIAVTGDDTFFGLALGLDGDGVPANAWSPVAGNNRITLDGSTQGGVKGDIIEVEDVAADVWAVQARLQQSGTEATPFSTV